MDSEGQGQEGCDSVLRKAGDVFRDMLPFILATSISSAAAIGFNNYSSYVKARQVSAEHVSEINCNTYVDAYEELYSGILTLTDVMVGSYGFRRGLEDFVEEHCGTDLKQHAYNADRRQK